MARRTTNPAPAATGPLLTPKDAAGYLAISESLVRRYANAADPSLRITSVRIGSLLRFRTADLDAWVAERVDAA